MPITQWEYQVKQLAFGLARDAIVSQDSFNEFVAEKALQIFIRVPGLPSEHEAAQKVIQSLNSLGKLAQQEIKERKTLRARVVADFSILDNTYDANRGFDHYLELGPRSIPIPEENRC